MFITQTWSTVCLSNAMFFPTCLFVKETLVDVGFTQNAAHWCHLSAHTHCRISYLFTYMIFFHYRPFLNFYYKCFIWCV